MSETKKNTMPEAFDEAPAGVKVVTKEEVLMTESELLQGLLSAAQEKDSESAYETIEIRRSGVLKFKFRIRPLSEEESMRCHDKATKFAPRRRGQPKTEIETNQPLMRSWLIYTATVDEDRAKTWENPRLLEALNLVQGVEAIDAVLLSGEKDRIIDRINDISGYGDDMEETAKN